MTNDEEAEIIAEETPDAENKETEEAVEEEPSDEESEAEEEEEEDEEEEDEDEAEAEPPSPEPMPEPEVTVAAPASEAVSPPVPAPKPDRIEEVPSVPENEDPPYEHYMDWRLKNNAMLLRVEGVLMAVEGMGTIMTELLKLMSDTEDDKIYALYEIVKRRWKHLDELTESIKEI